MSDDSNMKNPINIILKNKIIKLDNNYFNLSSLGLNVDFEIIMSGESSLFMFSRLENNFSPETVVCYINKDMDSPRKFLNYGLLMKNKDSSNYTLKTIRKQEIPKHGKLIKIFLFYV